MARTDYYNDPDAPPANSVVPSTTAVVTDDQDRIVLIRRRDNDLWALPGGGMELGESIVDTAVREVKEETGLDVEVTGLIGVYTNPHHVMAYTDGEVRQQFSLCFTTRLVGGDLLIDSESTDIAWTDPQDIPALNNAPVHATTDPALPRTPHHPIPRVGRISLPAFLAGKGVNASDGGKQCGRRQSDRAMHRIVFGVPRQDLAQPIISPHRRTVRAGRHVRTRQHIQQEIRRLRELGQRLRQPTLARLEHRPRVIGHQRHHQRRETLRPDKHSTV